MALQITAGPGSLISLGVSASDVYTLVTLGQRVGNWWMAESGDKDFLALLDQDEYEIIRRKGLVDLPTFNKRWRKQIRLLANGQPLSFEGSDAERVVKDMGRFTAVMVCMVAALDAFATISVVKRVLRSVLTDLLRTTESGEDLLNSQYALRLNSWRSSACLRGLSFEAQTMRQTLIDQELLLSGYMPPEESNHMALFLVWLLSNETQEFVTASSDVAGVATCLSKLGIDILSIDGEGYYPSEKPCRLVYSKKGLFDCRYQAELMRKGSFSRESSTYVSITHPVDIAVHNRCRSAWKSGQKAARHVSLDVTKLPEDLEFEVTQDQNPDLYYTFVDRGPECRRVHSEVNDLAVSHAPVINNELLSGLESCFERETPELLAWLYTQTRGGGLEAYEISDLEMIAHPKPNAFCVFQSYFLGYYYDVFFRMVDTSSFKLQIVEGAWGFRCPDILSYVRKYLLSSNSLLKNGKAANTRALSNATQPRPATDISRQAILTVLSRFFLNHPIDIPLISPTSDKTEHWCMGIVAKRTLVINSLLGKCQSIDEIGRFTLLDVDVGGIPRNTDGLIRPGCPDYSFELDVTNAIEENVVESSPPEDVTLHIEADWEADPDATLLCVRYKGRRVATISPARADPAFWKAYVQPTGRRSSQRRVQLLHAVPVHLSHLMASPPRLLMSGNKGIPVLFQAFNKARLRYSAVALYNGICIVRLASDNIEEAVAQGNKGMDRIGKRGALVVIAGSDL